MRTSLQTDNPLFTQLKGTGLIEASAGTGKTYTIAGLYLRLLLEKDLRPDQILVVTFTKAATEELKQKIRDNIVKALDVFQDRVEADKAGELFEFLKDNHDQTRATLTLRAAAADFDRNAIFTIHGFCQRILTEHAFASGSFFDPEIITDQRPLTKEITKDFWRKRLHLASAGLTRFLLGSEDWPGLNPDSLLSSVASVLNSQLLRVIPTPEENLDAEILNAEKIFARALNEVRQNWSSQRDKVAEILSGSPNLDRNKYRLKSIPKWFILLDRFLAQADPDPRLVEKFDKLTSDGLNQATKKNHLSPQHPFFDQCQNLKNSADILVNAYTQARTGLKFDLIQTLRFELAARKTLHGQMGYDDLLLNVHRAVSGPQVDALRRAVRARYQAALIDEFQDTDPVQYAIVKALFHDGNTPLFLIGDPKQAIYGFRGADVFTYLEASEIATDTRTLDINWRSDPGIITAVNTLFSVRTMAFGSDKRIAFHKVKPAPRIITRLEIQDDRPAFQFWLAAEAEAPKQKTMSKATARIMAAKATAAEISRLIALGQQDLAHLISTDGSKEDKKRLAAGDMAVLVRKNSEAALVRRELSSLKIPAVMYAAGSVFDTDMAEDLALVIAAVIEPGNRSLVSAALLTDLFNVEPRALDRFGPETPEGLVETGTTLAIFQDRFRSYHRMWTDQGFIRMIHGLIQNEGVIERILSLDNGERRLTDLLHLTELLHREESTNRLGMPQLMRWLLSQAKESGSQEEHQLRLESDERAVKILTIHRSKGLEFPVVFCPFAFDSRKDNKKTGFVFHNPKQHQELTLDLADPASPDHKALEAQERLAEDVRILYVALTRAKYRCHVVVGRITGFEGSALAYLLASEVDPALGPTGLADSVNTWTDASLKERLSVLTKASNGTMGIVPLETFTPSLIPQASETKPTIAARLFSGKIETSFGITSFSRLAASTKNQEDYPEEILLFEADPVASDPAKEKNITTFPRGARAGTFFHSILEHLDFSSIDPGHGLDLTIKNLAEFGFAPEWAAPLSEHIFEMMQTPLDDSGITLSQVGMAQRLNELEFYLPLRRITPKTLIQLFDRPVNSLEIDSASMQLEALTFAPVQGFLHGFMDCVFAHNGRYFLVDWKSNFLGTSVEDYSKAALRTVMGQELYALQYHLYTLALDRYLALRLNGYEYERHFGGVYYVFLRGMSPGASLGNGIFFDKPSGEFMAEMARSLIDFNPTVPNQR